MYGIMWWIMFVFVLFFIFGGVNGIFFILVRYSMMFNEELFYEYWKSVINFFFFFVLMRFIWLNCVVWFCRFFFVGGREGYMFKVFSYVFVKRLIFMFVVFFMVSIYMDFVFYLINYFYEIEYDLGEVIVILFCC